MRKARNQKGFTIMELLIVIVIIGILIAIAVPAYQNFRTRAQTTACQANMRTIKSGWGLWVADANPLAPVVAIAAGGLAASDLIDYLGTVPACPIAGAAGYAVTLLGQVSCTTHGNLP